MVIRTAVKSEWSIDNILLGAGFKGTVLIIKFKNIHKHCIFHSNCSNRFYPEFSDFLFSRFVPPLVTYLLDSQEQVTPVHV